MYNINEILDDICNAKFAFKSEVDGNMHEALVLPPDGFCYSKRKEVLRNVLEEHFNDLSENIFKMQIDMSKLQAKVFTYEHIIANSNFAPVIMEGEKHASRTRELENRIDKLEDFVKKCRQNKVQNVTLDDIHFLEEQLKYMRGYNAVLQCRIGRAEKVDE